MSTEVKISNVLDEFQMHELKGKNEFYTLAAINALLRIANNHTYLIHFEDAQRALVVVVQYNGSQCTTALPRIVRSFVAMIDQVQG